MVLLDPDYNYVLRRDHTIPNERKYRVSYPVASLSVDHTYATRYDAIGMTPALAICGAVVNFRKNKLSDAIQQVWHVDPISTYGSGKSYLTTLSLNDHISEAMDAMAIRVFAGTSNG